MSEITAALVQKLRNMTGAGIMDAKKILTKTKGDIAKAVEELRKSGQAKALKKQDRAVSEGLIDAYIHGTGKVGAMVQVKCETDFVARNEEFKALAHDIALQVTAMNPQYVSPKDIPQEVIDKEKEIYRAQLKAQKKPEKAIEKIVEGKLQKYFSEVCLLKQKFFKNDTVTIEDLITEKIAKLGENIQLAGFTRVELDGSRTCNSK
ncbi:MAG: elongation factor Ts [Candidatus Kerfeldbacteria bacterium RIFCSPHIGHO2_12_FULL_48_17]|uniref:Elongation factor Ts n=1 Tax=Candidatus Kerfeldbacteria bacterium RIFCSPHIGHO2_12_FULL_48_17 TaxID=1798542 RepID=A0A1G2B6J4_9BACT|nr:MAG: elongation factor Ts [Candidatus Kerfeldbacteria bacterium RIFCSPHIGHO2_12_FULL_48_17]